MQGPKSDDSQRRLPSRGDAPATNLRSQGTGPLLVYVPGLDGTGELLFKQLPTLITEYRVATFRLREDRWFTYEDIVEDLAAVIQHLGQRAILLAESFGGTVALQFALRHPELVDRMVIVNSFPRYRSRLLINLGAALAPRLPFRVSWYVRFAAISLGLTLDGVSRDDRHRFFDIIRGVKQEGYVRRLELIRDLDLVHSLPQIRVPTLFVAGARDLLVPSAREARLMAGRMPDAGFVILKNCGHACLLGNRAKLHEILAQFIKNNEPFPPANAGIERLHS